MQSIENSVAPRILELSEQNITSTLWSDIISKLDQRYWREFQIIQIAKGRIRHTKHKDVTTVTNLCLCIAFLQQKGWQIGSVLPGDSRN